LLHYLNTNRTRTIMLPKSSCKPYCITFILKRISPLKATIEGLINLFIFLNIKIYVILVIIVYRRRCVSRSSHWNLTPIQMWFRLEFFDQLLLMSQPFHLLIFLSSFFSPKLTLLGAWVTHFATLSNNYCLHGINW
jgi:hypothetical protein